MLVLSRKLREQIQIGDHITVTILRVKGNAVRLGIEAPRDVKVVRKELPPESKGIADGFATDDERVRDRLSQAKRSEVALSAQREIPRNDGGSQAETNYGMSRRPQLTSPTTTPLNENKVPSSDRHVAVFVSDPHRDHVVEITPSGTLNSLKRRSDAADAGVSSEEGESQETDSEGGLSNRVAQHLEQRSLEQRSFEQFGRENHRHDQRGTQAVWPEASESKQTQNSGIERLRQIVAAVSQSGK